jgi:hypothetical protein
MVGTSRAATTAGGDSLVERAARLFAYLGRVQQLRTPTPHSVDDYRSSGGMVLWLADLPDHPAVTIAGRYDVPAPEDTVVSIDRVPSTTPPSPDKLLTGRLTGAFDDPDDPPRLRDISSAVGLDISPDGAGPAGVDEVQQVRAAFDDWIVRWDAWAERERTNRPVRTRYEDLFSAYQTVTGNPGVLRAGAGLGVP